MDTEFHKPAQTKKGLLELQKEAIADTDSQEEEEDPLKLLM